MAKKGSELRLTDDQRMTLEGMCLSSIDERLLPEATRNLLVELIPNDSVLGLVTAYKDGDLEAAYNHYSEGDSSYLPVAQMMSITRDALDHTLKTVLAK